MSRMAVVFRRLWVCPVVFVSLALGPSAAHVAAGQSITTDASIIGQVTDEQGGVLPGVSVTATSPALQVPSVSSMTDERGEYRLTPLPIGVYVVEYSLQGFQVVRREQVRLGAGFTAKIDIAMNVGTLEETVTVSGATPLVDVAATNTVTQLTKEQLDVLPTSRTGLSGVLQLVPGMRQAYAQEAGMQSFSTAAFGRTTQPWQAIEGIVTVGPRAATSGNMFDYSMFEEATVSTLGHDASVPNSGVNVNSVIKSGGNDFHGQAFYAFTDDNFQTGGEVGGLTTTIKDDLTGQVGGRIVRDKLWFSAGARTIRDYAELVGSSVCVKPDGAPCDNVSTQRYFTFKPTYQPNPSHRLVGLYYVGRGRNRTATTLGTWDSRRDHNFRPHVWKGEWQWVKGNALVVAANVGGWSAMSGSVCPDAPDRSLKRDREDNDLSLCTGVATTDSVTRVTSGLHGRTGERTQEGRIQGRVNASYYKPDWFHGNHEFKAGFDVFHLPQNRIHVGRGEAGNQQLTFRGGLADQIVFWNYPIDPDLNIRYYGTYVADSWTIGRKLTLNLGIRHAYDAAYENPTCRVAADYPSAEIYPAECFDEVRMPVYNTWAPRLRAAYDLTADGRTVVKGGWGRYTVMRVTDDIAIAAKQVGAASTYRWLDPNGNKQYEPGEVNLAPNGPDFISRLGGDALPSSLQGGIVNPDETAPYEDEYSIQLERQVSQLVAVRVTGLHTRTLNEIRIGNALRPYEVYNIPITNPDPGPDGVVGNTDDTGTQITYFDYPQQYAGLAFQQVMFVNDSRANRHFNSVELAVSKLFSANWEFRASYTATKLDVPLVPNATRFNTQDPNSEINAADNTWEWQAKASGSYTFPYGFAVSANFEHRSGTVTARTASFRGAVRVGTLTLRVEPIGSIRLPDNNMLDFRAEKRFSLPNGQRINLGLNVYNALNDDAATAVTVQSGPSFGVVTGRLRPRTMELQARYQF